MSSLARATCASRSCPMKHGCSFVSAEGGGLEVVRGPPATEDQSDFLTVNLVEYGVALPLDRLGFVSFDALTAHCVGQLLRLLTLSPAPCVLMTLFWPRSLSTDRSLGLLSECLAEVARYKAVVMPLLARRRWFARLRLVSPRASQCELHDVADATSGVVMGRVGFVLKALVRELSELEVDVVHVYSEFSNNQRSMLRRARASSVTALILSYIPPPPPHTPHNDTAITISAVAPSTR